MDVWSGGHPPTKTPFHGDVTKGRLCHVPANRSFISGHGMWLSQEPACRICLLFLLHGFRKLMSEQVGTELQNWTSGLRMRMSMSFKDLSPTLHLQIRFSTLLHSCQANCYCLFSTGTLRNKICNDKFWQACYPC